MEQGGGVAIGKWEFYYDEDKVLDRYYYVTSKMWSLVYETGLNDNPRQGESFFLRKEQYENLVRRRTIFGNSTNTSCLP